MSDLKCAKCGKNLNQSTWHPFGEYTLCSDCYLEILKDDKSELVKKQWIPIVMYGIPNILCLVGFIINILYSNGLIEMSEPLSVLFSVVMFIGGLYGLVSVGIIVAKKRTFLKIGSPEATQINVDDYGDTVMLLLRLPIQDHRRQKYL